MTLKGRNYDSSSLIISGLAHCFLNWGNLKITFSFPILVLWCECPSWLLSSSQQTFLICWMMKCHILRFAWNVSATWCWRRRTPRDQNNPPASSALLHFSWRINHRSNIVTTVSLPASPNTGALSTLLDTAFVNNCCLSRHNKFVHGVCSLQAALHTKEKQ